MKKGRELVLRGCANLRDCGLRALATSEALIEGSPGLGRLPCACLCSCAACAFLCACVVRVHYAGLLCVLRAYCVRSVCVQKAMRKRGTKRSPGVAALKTRGRNVACVCRSCLCLNMEPAAVAALAVAVDHDLAPTLRSLVHHIEELTRETQELAQQALQYRRDLLSMRGVVAAALQNLRRNDLDSVERLLQGCD